MRLLSILKIAAYSIPIAGVMYILWGTQISAMDNKLLARSDANMAPNLSMEPIQPVPLNTNLNPVIVELGETLFNAALMSDKGVACIACHNINVAGNDGLKVSIDIRGGNDLMNTPTVFNVGMNPLLTWFGESKTLEEQIEMVLANPKHMDGDWESIIERINNDTNLKVRFEKIFDDGVTRSNIKMAIADYERSLITPNSDFDNYLRGDNAAISKEQKKGYGLFKQYGCIACHQGINVGGNLHAKLGTFSRPFNDSEADTPQSKYNLGRYNITGDENDRHVFRVPSLRNVEKTSPYFHTGEIGNLEDAIKFMAKYQIGRDMQDEDAYYIAKFLRALTGEYKGRRL